MTRSQGPSSGFSLVEILMILAIIGILTMVGATFSQNKSRPAVRGTVEALVATLSEGRQLARTTGQRVTLHVNGTESQDLTLGLEYVDPGTSLPTRGGGLEVRALDSVLRNHAAIGVGGNQLALVSPDLAALRKTPLVSDWDLFLRDTNALFSGGERTAYSFDPSGQASGDFFITVTAPSAAPGSPFGLVLVTRDNGLHAFIKSGAAEPWRSL